MHTHTHSQFHNKDRDCAMLLQRGQCHAGKAQGAATISCQHFTQIHTHSHMQNTHNIIQYSVTVFQHRCSRLLRLLCAALCSTLHVFLQKLCENVQFNSHISSHKTAHKRLCVFISTCFCFCLFFFL